MNAGAAGEAARTEEEEEAYLAQRQSTMDSATLDKLLRAEKHLLQAGQATANAWRLIGRAPTDGDNPSGGSSADEGAEVASSPPPALGSSSSGLTATGTSSSASSSSHSFLADRRLVQSFHHTAPGHNGGGSGAGAGGEPSSSPRFPMAIPRPDGGRASLGAYPSAGSERPVHFGARSVMDFSSSASADANVMAENGRSRSTHGNLFGYMRDAPPQSDVTLFTFTVKKSDSVLEKLGSRRASIQLQVDVEGRMLNFLSPHEAKESYSCAAVTAKPQARLGMQLKIQTNAASLNKKITFFSVEDRANFVTALEEGKVMYRNKASPHHALGGNSGGNSGGFGAGNAGGGGSRDANAGTSGSGSAAQGGSGAAAAAAASAASSVSAANTPSNGVNAYDKLRPPMGMIVEAPLHHSLHMSVSSRAATELMDDTASVVSGDMRKLRESIVTDHFGTLPGESVLEHVQRVTNLVVMSGSDRAVQGVLKITSYRITFTPYDASWKFGSFELPLAAIDLITRESLMLLITCKDMRTLRLSMHDAYSRKKGYDQLPSTPDFRWLNLLTLRMKPPNMIGALFAFDYHTEKAKDRSVPLTEMTNGWFVYSPFAEYQRLGFLTAHKSMSGVGRGDEDAASPITWRLLKNSKFRFSPTYPQLMVVPSLMSEEQLVQSARFRSRARLPVVVWRHPVNKSVLARSSQPNYGMAGNRSEPDRILLRAYRDSANKNSVGGSPPLHIIDARKPIATKGNRLKGKGVENSQHYDNAQIEFMGIANIHKMRESWEALKALVSPSSVEDGDKHYHNRLENTRWLKHVMRVLSGARRVAEVLHEDGASVLVHCSDGWDRTPQMVALAQLILDPYYRSIRGFAALVEKEWCSFGHKFADRIGVGKDITDQPNERSPVMMQFLDCVWQMTRQFPTCFEFNEKFLLHIADALISGLYGTFLYNSERERFLDKVWERTESVWTPVLEHPGPFRNLLYRQTNRVLYPRANLKRVVLWDAMFFRWDPESHPDYMEYMEPVGHHHHEHHHDDDGSEYNAGDASVGGRDLDDNASELGSDVAANDLSGVVVGGITYGGNRPDPTGLVSPSILPIEAGGELDAEEKAMQLEIDGIHDYDEFRSKVTLSDCSDMSDDDDDISPSDAGGAGDNREPFIETSGSGDGGGDGGGGGGGVPSRLMASAAANLEDLLAQFDDETLERYQRAVDERMRQRAQGRNLREAIQTAPDQSRIKFLEQLLSESVARELQLEAELDSVLHRVGSIVAGAVDGL